MGKRVKRPRLVALKFKTLAVGLVGLALVGYVKHKQVSLPTPVSSGRFLAGAGEGEDEVPLGLRGGGCNCSSCFVPPDYARTCCERNSSLCLTPHHEVCSADQLCAAEVNIISIFGIKW